MQPAPQSCNAPWQRHTATWHAWPVPQMVPQAPQFKASEATLAQIPLQLVSPAAHIAPPVVEALLFPPAVPGWGVVVVEQLTAADNTVATINKMRNFNVDFIPDSLR